MKVTVEDLLRPAPWGQGSNRAQAQYYFHPRLKATLKELAAKRGVSENRLVAELLLGVPEVKQIALHPE